MSITRTNRLITSTDKIKGLTVFVEDAVKEVSNKYTGIDVTAITEPVINNNNNNSSSTLIIVSKTTGDAQILTSLDLISFSVNSSIIGSAGIIWNAVSWSKELNILVAVGTDNKISVSNDSGVTWNTTNITIGNVNGNGSVNGDSDKVEWSDVTWADSLMSFIIIGTTPSGNAIISNSTFDNVSKTLSWSTRRLMSNSYMKSISWSHELRRLVSVGYGIDPETDTPYGVILTNIRGTLTSWNRGEYYSDILEKVIWIPQLSNYVVASKDLVFASSSGLIDTWVDISVPGNWNHVSWSAEMSAIILAQGTSEISVSSDLTIWNSILLNNPEYNLQYINWNGRLGRFILTTDTSIDVSISIYVNYSSTVQYIDGINSISAGNLSVTGNYYKNDIYTPYTPQISLETSSVSLWSKTTGGNLIYTKGNIAIGKTTANYIFDINGTTSADNFTGQTANFSDGITNKGRFQISGNSKFGNYLTFTNGNVNINAGLFDINQDYALDINGNLGVASNVEANGSTSDLGNKTIRFGDLWCNNTGANFGNTIWIGQNLISNTVGSTSYFSNLRNLGNTSLLDNVGIGTTAPSAKLDISGGLSVSGLFNAILDTNTIGNVFTTGGNVGIDIIAPSAKLDISGGLSVSSSINGVSSTNTIGNVFTTGGNVGIGTTAPSAKLDVAGDLRLIETVSLSSSSLRMITGGILQITGNTYNPSHFITNITGELQQNYVRAGKMTKIATGTAHSLALDYFTGEAVVSRGVSGWGAALGNGLLVNQISPLLITSGALTSVCITNVACGDSHSLVVDSLGRVYAWGANNSGQLGNGNQNSILSTTQHPKEALSSNDTTLYQASASSFAATNTNPWQAFDLQTSSLSDPWSSTYAYGVNGNYIGSASTLTNLGTCNGEWLGLRLKQNSMIVKKIILTSTNINLFPTELIILGSNEINPTSWNVIGTIGNLSYTNSIVNIFTSDNTNAYNNYRFVITRKTPNIVDIVEIRELSLEGLDISNTSVTGGEITNSQVISIAGGSDFSLALDVTGQVYSWGANGAGQLGNGTTTASTLPIKVTGGSLSGQFITEIAAGGSLASALDASGRVHSWGGNQTTPVLATGGSLSGVKVVSIECGSNFYMALDTSGRVHTWGTNSSGQLGNGTTIDQSVPILVTGGSLNGRFVTGIAAGGTHSLALDTTGRVHAWGGNGSGQLGDNSTTQRTSAFTVTGGSLSSVRIASVAAGGAFSLALDSLGQIHGWGANESGQLGDNSTTQRTLPVLTQRPTLNFTAQHNCILDTNGLNGINSTVDLTGLIVVADKNTYSSGAIEHKSLIRINEALPVVSLSQTPKDKRVFGVISSDSSGTVNSYLQSDWEQNNFFIYKPINSIGEGGIWVCDENGPLESGDYITSSSIPGYGMRQTEPFMCNYTVAKITASCDFTGNIIRYINKDGTQSTTGTCLAKFVGCTYHCG